MAKVIAPRSRKVTCMVGGVVIALLASACSSAPASSSAAAPGGQPSAHAGVTAPAVGPTDAPASGAWTGTITFHAVVNKNKTTNNTSGDPGSTYYETSTTTETNTGDATDTFAIAAPDPDDLTYGIDVVDLKGSASTTGTEDFKTVIQTNKSNSSCTWKEELGDEVGGAWTDSGISVGELRFSEDGKYSIDIHADNSGPNGEQPDGPQIDHRIWLKNSDISAGCTGDPDYDTTSKEGPTLHWASSFLGEPDVNGVYASIDGSLSPASPGSTVDGTATWNIALPELTLTIGWHLVHNSPIALPHS